MVDSGRWAAHGFMMRQTQHLLVMGYMTTAGIAGEGNLAHFKVEMACTSKMGRASEVQEKRGTRTMGASNGVGTPQAISSSLGSDTVTLIPIEQTRILRVSSNSFPRSLACG